ncbi:MAG: hypothetical protein FJ356_02090 [Thaumarchaeota archaeon]|nr:hypothetical protein [Nitrososphaerota archaeon]
MAVLLVSSSLFSQNVFASGSFTRQELIDNAEDWRDENSKWYEGDAYTDLNTITYLSDGKNFNATFWLTGTFFAKPPRDMVKYGILIDADANSKTGLFGFDYSTEIKWDGSSWTKTFEERTRYNFVRILNIEKNFTDFYDVGGKTVRLSFDLESIGSPEQYSVVFYTSEDKEIDGAIKTLNDVSALANIPPPEFFITTLPESIILKQGEEKRIQVQVKSTTGFQPQVNFIALPISDITLNFTSNELLVPSFGVTSMPIDIIASEKAEPGTRMLIIKANATFPLDKILREDESDPTKFLHLEEDFVIEKAIPVTVVIEEFTSEDAVVEFVDKWQVLIYSLATLGTGGVLFGLKDRISKFFKSRKQQKITDLLKE